MSLGRRSVAAARDGGTISIANDRRRSTGIRKKVGAKERELGSDCAGGGNMTLDFWAAVGVGSVTVAFLHDFDWKAILFHKDTAESSGTAGGRFVFSKLMSRGGDSLPLIPELAKWSGRGRRVRRPRWHRGSFRQAQRTWDGKVAAPVEGCLPSPGLLGNHPSAWFYRSPTEIRGTTGRSPYTEIITQRRRLVKRRQCLLLPRVGAPRPAFTAWSSGRRRR